MTNQGTSAPRREQGMALFVAVFILTLVSMVALTGIQNSENEATASGRSRSTMRVLYAADAGIELASSRLAQMPPDLTAFDIDLGGGRRAQSRTRTDTSTQPLSYSGIGPPPEGYALHSGGGSTGYATDVYQVNVTATSNTGSIVEVESKMGILSDGGGY